MKIMNGRRKHVLKEAAQPAAAAGDSRPARSRASACRSASGSAAASASCSPTSLLSPTTRQRGYFEPAFVDRIVDEHLTGKRDHTLRLWQLLVFELWHRQYIDAAGATVGVA